MPHDWLLCRPRARLLIGALTVIAVVGCHPPTELTPPWIAAGPNPVPPGYGRGRTVISWDAGNATGEVWVSIDGGSETLFAGESSRGSQEATWIDQGVDYEFRLYRGRAHQDASARIRVFRKAGFPIERWAQWLLAASVAPLVLAVPRWLGLIVASSGTAAVFLLTAINDTKIALTQSPLTALDFKIAMLNPSGLWTALNWPQWTLHATLTAIALAGIIVVLLSARRWRQQDRRQSPGGRGRLLRGAVLLAVPALTAAALGPTLADRAATDPALWEPDKLAAYSQSIGVVPFLLLSYELETKNTGLYFDDSGDADPPNAVELALSSSRYVAPAQSRLPTMSPNIVVLFAESTFNPDWAFELSTPVDSPLFEPQDDTQVVSPLHVNAVGGGSWIEEFESLVGVDSRLFGYSGYYTHSTLSPFVRKSFVTYLNDKGYDTAAYYPWSGAFYNARRAFANYGFRRFYDGADLALTDTDSDVAIANAALRSARSVEGGPFFAFVGLAENHGPHPCRHFKRPEDFGPRFVATHDFRMTCTLNEYARRLQSTWAAFQEWSAYLRELEKSTGRPYVLAIFGDHQPYTFTPGAADNYASVRTAASLRQTFLHLRSSMRGIVSCCRIPPPVTLLPSLLSAFTASSAEELYLPESFYFYQHCGSDLLGGSLSLGVYDSDQRSTSAAPTTTCRTALARGLVSLRAYGVF
jgi:hypothetical protein